MITAGGAAHTVTLLGAYLCKDSGEERTPEENLPSPQCQPNQTNSKAAEALLTWCAGLWHLQNGVLLGNRTYMQRQFHF